MQSELEFCEKEVEELLLRVINIRQEAEKNKEECVTEIKKLDILYSEYESLRKKYLILEKETLIVQKSKYPRVDLKFIEDSNSKMKKEIRKCNSKLSDCNNAVEDLQTSIEIIEKRMSENYPDQKLFKEIEKLDRRIDLDKQWTKLSVPFNFKNLKDCEKKVSELTDILQESLKVSTDLKKYCDNKLQRGKNLKFQYDELKNEYEKVCNSYKNELKDVDDSFLRVFMEEEALKNQKMMCYSALMECDKQFKILNGQYSEFKSRWQIFKKNRLRERKERVKQLNKDAEMKRLNLSTLDMKNTLSRIKTVKFVENPKEVYYKVVDPKFIIDMKLTQK